MRILSTTCSLLALTVGLHAQANDFSGLRVFVSNGTTGAPTPLACGTPFTCTPYVFTAAPNDNVGAIVMGRLNELYIVAASLDTTLPCIDPMIPGLVNNYALVPGLDTVVALGVASLSDSGRCNGGTSGNISLFTIPPGLPSGSVLFQAISGTPLSAGGFGFAFSIPVQMNF